MNIDRITYLVDRLHTGIISDVENNELLTWYRSVAYQDAEYPTEELKVKGRMLYRLLKDTGFIHQLETKRRRLKSIWYSAAACLLLSFFALTFFLYSAKDRDKGQLLVQENKVDYLPGGNKAQLLLDDGSVIDLNSHQSSLIMGDKITYADGSMVENKEVLRKGSSQLELSIPRGGQYQLTLADGTKVWLNSESRLKYPLHFTGKERTIELEGEAYFEVSHNYKPFVVKTDRQRIQVLGTKFNVSSYSDNTVATTTLLEGSVRVSTPYGNNLLAPGHELVVTTSGSKMNEVYAKDAIAWKEGLFVFDNITLDAVMDKVSRWYNVDIHFVDEGLKKELVFAVIKKSENISVVLDKIASTGIAAFKVERGHINVTKNSKK